MTWFDVDRKGLRQIVAGKDPFFVLRELIQNAWDEQGTTRVIVALTPMMQPRGMASLIVKDDAPEGFSNLAHAYTLFLQTSKRGNPQQRGRFCLGEKHVLALCEEASIETTKGTVEFRRDGTRKEWPRRKTEKGSTFCAMIRLNHQEVDEVIRTAKTLLPPPGILTVLNDETIEPRQPLAIVEATLETEIADSEGIIRRSTRKTTVYVHEPRAGEVGTLYEMGLPVVETGDAYHYDVQQKVPLNADRDNVRPAFLRDVRAVVLNATVSRLSDDAASESWVREACQDELTTPETFRSVCDKRWGDKRVVADPCDPRSKERALASGYTIVPPGSLSRDEWDKARESGAIPSSSKLFPTLAADSRTLAEDELTEDMLRFRDLVLRVARVGLQVEVTIVFVDSPKADTAAQYGSRVVSFNVGRLGRGKWWKADNIEEHLRLIVHELGHEFGGHMEEGYYQGLARIAARLALAGKKELGL